MNNVVRYQIALALAIVPLCALAWWLIQSTPYLSSSPFASYHASLDHSKQNAVYHENGSYSPGGFHVNLESGQFQNLSSTEVLTALSKRIDYWLLVDKAGKSHIWVLSPHQYRLHDLETNPNLPIELTLDWYPNLVHGGFLVGENDNQLMWIDCQNPKLETKSTDLSKDTTKYWRFLHSDERNVYFVARVKSGFLLLEFTTIDREFVRVRELELPQRPILVNEQIVCVTSDLTEISYHDRNTGKLIESFTIPYQVPVRFEIAGKSFVAEHIHDSKPIFSIDQKRWLPQHSNPEARFAGILGDYSIFHNNGSVDLISNSNGTLRTIEATSNCGVEPIDDHKLAVFLAPYGLAVFDISTGALLIEHRPYRKIVWGLLLLVVGVFVWFVAWAWPTKSLKYSQVVFRDTGIWLIAALLLVGLLSRIPSDGIWDSNQSINQIAEGALQAILLFAILHCWQRISRWRFRFTLMIILYASVAYLLISHNEADPDYASYLLQHFVIQSLVSGTLVICFALIAKPILIPPLAMPSPTKWQFGLVDLAVIAFDVALAAVLYKRLIPYLNIDLSMVDIQSALVHSAILAAVTCVFLTKLSQPKLFILIGLLVAALLSESIYRFLNGTYYYVLNYLLGNDWFWYESEVDSTISAFRFLAPATIGLFLLLMPLRLSSSTEQRFSPFAPQR